MTRYHPLQPSLSLASYMRHSHVIAQVLCVAWGRKFPEDRQRNYQKIQDWPEIDDY